MYTYLFSPDIGTRCSHK